ncbi:MAG: hypothetical protein O2923_07690 [Verrucomicrobia bacterium]|nr:hypothetical protein [Verrucomicrobiota bacterium]
MRRVCPPTGLEGVHFGRVVRRRFPAGDPGNLVYVMYSPSIARNVQGDFGEIVANVRGLDLPCLSAGRTPTAIQISPRLRFGFIGFPFP